MGSPFTLINYYAPNNQSDQLKNLKEIQAKLKNIQIIDGPSYIWGRGGGGGDWNCILDKSLDSVGGNIKLKKDTIKEIEKLKSDFDLLDIWRARNPSFCRFSWRRTKPVTLTLFQPGGGGIHPPSRFFPRHRHKNQSIDSKLSDV